MEFAASCPSICTMPRYMSPAASSYPMNSAFSALESDIASLTSFALLPRESGHPSAATPCTESASSRPIRRSNVRKRSRTHPKQQSFMANTKDATSSRIFKCTFCFEAFRTKFEWARHEKSLHLNMEEWACAPYGGMIISDLTGAVHCAYCNILDPTVDHLEQHHHRACRGPSEDIRRFSRKDHLIQHLRHFHRLESLPDIEDWKFEGTQVSSRCGFCGTGLATWPQRADHLALHFRQGKTMDDWSGDHGFLPSVAARIKNSIPPCLIGNRPSYLESFSPTASGSPNMALDKHQQEVFNQMQSDLEGADLDHICSLSSLRSTIGSGRMPSDNMFQRESKRLLLSWIQGRRLYIDDWGWS